MDKTIALKQLISKTNQYLGSVPTTPADFNELSLRIEKCTGHPVSASTLKRVWGYVAYDSFPSPNTLNTLCLFIGAGDWQSFMNAPEDVVEIEVSDFTDLMEVDIPNLNAGDIVKATWHGGKGCEMVYIGDQKFRLLKADNIKLTSGDVFRMEMLKVGSPFCALDIKRSDTIIPGYVGARSNGISSLEIM